jgi:hypothetical protein
MDKPPYYVLCIWTTIIRTVVYVAMDVDIILLGESTKSDKLATFPES